MTTDCDAGLFSASKKKYTDALMLFADKSSTPIAISKFLVDLVKDPQTFSDIGNTLSERKLIQDGMVSFSWNAEVLDLLDCPDFLISDTLGLKNLVRILLWMFPELPLDFLYKLWKNKEGQMSWISCAIRNPGVFCFTSFPYTSVDVSCLMDPPNPHEVMRHVEMWMSLELINILLLLSDNGYQTQVMELLEFPMDYCPELLLAGILQIDCWNHVKSQVMIQLIPKFFKIQSSNFQILHFVWNVKFHQADVRSCVLRAIHKWYEGDKTDSYRVSTIYSIAKHLEILKTIDEDISNLAIDLAFFASVQKCLLLKEWVKGKLSINKDHFIEIAVSFIRERISIPLFLRRYEKEDGAIIEFQNCSILHSSIMEFELLTHHDCPNLHKISHILDGRNKELTALER